MTAQQVFRNTLIVLLTLVLAYTIIVSARILIVFLIAIIIASAVRPLIVAMTRRHIPISLAIVIIYFSLGTMLILLTVAVIPPIVNQFAGYIENESQLAYRIIAAQRWVEGTMSDLTNSNVSLVAPDQILTAVSSFVEQFRQAMPSLLDDIGATVSDGILIFVIGAYWLTSHQRATAFITELTPPRFREKTARVIGEIEQTLGGYVRGVVIIATIVGILNFVILQLLGVPDAVTLSFIIAISSIIPMIGSIIGIVIAAVIAVISSPQTVIPVVVVSFVIEQIRSYVLSPRIISGQVSLDPLLIIVYTAIGFVTLGITGALIAVPIMATVHILLVALVIEPYRESIKQFHTEKGIPVLKNDEEPDTKSAKDGHVIAVQPSSSAR